MNIREAIYERRSVRKYLPEFVDPRQVVDLLDAATQAPSAMNQQPWAFAVIHGPERLKAMSKRIKAHVVATFPPFLESPLHTDLYTDPEYDVFHGAPVAVVIYALPSRFDAKADCCLAAQNLMLAACEFGLGTCPIGYAREWFDTPEVKYELGIPGACHAVMPIAVGRPDGTPARPGRNPPNILHWDWAMEPLSVQVAT